MTKGGKVFLIAFLVFCVAMGITVGGPEATQYVSVPGVLSIPAMAIGSIMWVVEKIKSLRKPKEQHVPPVVQSAPVASAPAPVQVDNAARNEYAKEIEVLAAKQRELEEQLAQETQKLQEAQRALTKKSKKWPYVMAFIFVAVIICGMFPSEKMAVESEATGEQRPSAIVESAPSPTVAPTATHTATPTALPTQTPIPAPGESRETAFVLTVEEFVKEINANKNAAAEKYNGKYVELTGKITDISPIGDLMTGYYVYGKRLGKGLNITCWVYDSISLDLSTGTTATFQGIVREITTVNNTELGECIIIK